MRCLPPLQIIISWLFQTKPVTYTTKVVNTSSNLTSYTSEIPLGLHSKHNNIEIFTIQKNTSENTTVSRYHGIAWLLLSVVIVVVQVPVTLKLIT